MRKILEANIKTIDEKGHITFFTKYDIDEISFKRDKVKEAPKPKDAEPKKETPKEPKKETKKKSKK